MGGLGFPYDEIAAEIGRRYRVRPREAYRLAWGWTLALVQGLPRQGQRDGRR